MHMTKVFTEVKAHVALVILALALAGAISVSCGNVFAPAAPPPPPTDFSRYTYDELVTYGVVELNAGNHANALAYFDAAITAKPSGSEARYYAATASIRKEWVQVFDVLGLFITNMNNTNGGTNDIFTTIFDYVNSNENFTLFATNGPFGKAASYLNDDGGYSVVLGECDGVVASNSFFVNLDLLFANVFLLAGRIFDLDGDGTYSMDFNISNLMPTNLTGMMASVSDMEGLEDPSSMSYATITNTLALVETAHNGVEEVFVLVDGTLMPLFSRLTTITECSTRMLTGFSNSPALTNAITSNLDAFMEPLLANTNGGLSLSNFLDFESLMTNIFSVMNDMHVMLVGVAAYDGGTYTPSAWSSHTTGGGIKGALETAASLIGAMESLTNLADLNSLDEITNALEENWDAITNTLAADPALASVLTNVSNVEGFVSNIESFTNSLTNVFGATNDISGLLGGFGF